MPLTHRLRHLLQNIIEVGERFLQRQHGVLRQVAQEIPAHRSVAVSSTQPEPTPPPGRSETPSTAARAQRVARYERTRALYPQGMSLRAIAHLLHLHRRTVRQFVTAEVFPERAMPRRSSCLPPFVPHLQRRWAAGCHNAAVRWRKIRGQGFHGTANLVCLFVKRWRSRRPGPGRRANASLALPAVLPFPTPRHAS